MLVINGAITLILGFIPGWFATKIGGFWFENFLILILGACTGLYQVSLYGTAGSLGDIKIMTAVQVGIGVSSLFVNLIRIIFLAANSDFEEGAFFFFVSSGFILLAIAVLSFFAVI